MHRIDKTIQILPAVKIVLEQISLPQTWLVLTEGWCGDVAQIVQVLAAMVGINQNIELLLLLRHENSELLDQYLTSGTRSIPKLIVLNTATMEELFNYIFPDD